MKITVELPDQLLDQAREIMAEEGTTLERLIEAGLRQELAQRKEEDRLPPAQGVLRWRGTQRRARKRILGADSRSSLRRSRRVITRSPPGLPSRRKVASPPGNDLSGAILPAADLPR